MTVDEFLALLCAFYLWAVQEIPKRVAETNAIKCRLG